MNSSFSVIFTLLIVASFLGVSLGSRRSKERALALLTNHEQQLLTTGDADKTWQTVLVASPTVITLLGNLMVLSSKVDFSLRNPNRTYEFIRNPDSFRATLVQISNDAYMAFQTAHTNMYAIQLSMEEIPPLLVKCLQFLTSGNDKLAKRFIPKKLDAVERHTELTVKKAIETEQAFMGVMKLLAEVLESTTDASGKYGQLLQEVRTEIAVSDQAQKDLSELIKQQAIEVAEKKVIAAEQRRKFNEALDDLPGSWEVLGAQIISKLVNLHLRSTEPKATSENGEESDDDKKTTDKMLCSALSTASLDGLPEMETTAASLIEDPRNGNTKMEPVFRKFKITTTLIKDSLTRLDAIDGGEQYIADFIDTMDKLITICDNLLAESTLTGTEKSSMKDKIALFSTWVKRKTNDCCVKSNTLPHSPKKKTESDEGVSTAHFGDNEKLAVDLSQKVLENAEASYEKQYELMKTFQNEMREMMSNMILLKADNIQFSQIVSLLQQGTRLLARIRRQWAELVKLTTKVAEEAKVTLKSRVDLFVENIDSSDTHEFIEEESIRNDVIENTQSVFFTVSHLHMISKAYVQVSDKYILSQIAGIAELTTESGDMETSIREITKKGEATNAEIEMLVTEKHDEFIQKLVENKGRYDRILNGEETEGDKFFALFF